MAAPLHPREAAPLQRSWETAPAQLASQLTTPAELADLSEQGSQVDQPGKGLPVTLPAAVAPPREMRAAPTPYHHDYRQAPAWQDESWEADPLPDSLVLTLDLPEPAGSAAAAPSSRLQLAVLAIAPELYLASLQPGASGSPVFSPAFPPEELARRKSPPPAWRKRWRGSGRHGERWEKLDAVWDKDRVQELCARLRAMLGNPSPGEEARRGVPLLLSRAELEFLVRNFRARRT